MKEINCPNCGKQVEDGGVICPHCNARLCDEGEQDSYSSEATNEIVNGDVIESYSSQHLPFYKRHDKKTLLWVLGSGISYILVFILLISLGVSASGKSKLHDEISNLQIAKTELQDKTEDLASDVATYEETNQKLLAQVKNASDQQTTIDDLNKQLSELQTKYTTLETENAGLKAQQAASVPTEQVSPQTVSQSNEETVHITDTGGKYHNGGCRYLKQSDTTVTLSQAQSMGLTPCKVCH